MDRVAFGRSQTLERIEKEKRRVAYGRKRELILKLGQKITDRIGHKVTVDDPEYWGLPVL